MNKTKFHSCISSSPKKHTKHQTSTPSIYREANKYLVMYIDIYEDILYLPLSLNWGTKLHTRCLSHALGQHRPLACTVFTNYISHFFHHK